MNTPKNLLFHSALRPHRFSVCLDFLVILPNFFFAISLSVGVSLNEFIKHYEPAFYNVEEVTKQHKRIKRGAGSYEKNNFPLRLTITTSNR